MPPGDARGFTLLEVIVVIAVLGLLGGLVLMRGPPRSAALELRGAVAAVAGAMRLARSEAIATNRPVPVLLDGAAGLVAVAGRPPRALPRDVALAVVVPADEPGGRITFLPDGSATGGSVLLRAAGGSAQVGVDWLSGRVSVAGGRRDAP